MIKPTKLKKGDKVAIVSLSSGLAGEDLFRHRYEQGKKRLEEEFGLNVVTMPNALKGLDYLNEHPDVFVYSRSDDEVRVGVISNMKNYQIEVEIPFEMDKILLQNYDKKYNSNKLLLEPYETIVGKIK